MMKEKLKYLLAYSFRLEKENLPKTLLALGIVTAITFTWTGGTFFYITRSGIGPADYGHFINVVQVLSYLAFCIFFLLTKFAIKP
ncbi:hypothetical protein [Viscerimonas tarda]